MFSNEATKIDEIFTFNLTLCSKCQNYGEDFFNFRGLLENVNFKLRYQLLKNTVTGTAPLSLSKSKDICFWFLYISIQQYDRKTYFLWLKKSDLLKMALSPQCKIIAVRRLPPKFCNIF